MAENWRKTDVSNALLEKALGMGPQPVSKVFTDEELWAFLGLSGSSRHYVEKLLRAKAWAKLADLHPAAEKAVQLVDRHIADLEERERRKRVEERKRAEAIWKKYSEGMNSLGDLIDDLRDLAGLESED